MTKEASIWLIIKITLLSVAVEILSVALFSSGRISWHKYGKSAACGDIGKYKKRAMGSVSRKTSHLLPGLEF